MLKVPHNRYYWSSDIQIPAVSEYMLCRRWETIKSNLHFSDNEKAIPKSQDGYDKLYKIRSFIDLLNNRFNKVELPEHLSVDEQMIPYCGKNGPWMYVKGKPNPWGFKVWALASTCGFIHNVDFCVTATPAQEVYCDLCSISNLVLKLASIIPSDANYKISMDSLFTGVPLFFELRKRGIHCLGTVQLPRASGLKKVVSNECDLIRNKHSYKEYDGKLDNKGEGLRVIRWNDNKVVNIMTTFGSALPLGTCQRWDREVNANRKVTVPCPGLISYYNKNMGGI